MTVRLPGALWLLCAACTSQTTSHSGTGLTGAAVPEGSLAGSFGVSLDIATRVTVPVLGQRNGGRHQTHLVTRTYDAVERVYRETYRLCSLEYFEVEGTQVHVTDAMISHLAPVDFVTDVDHSAGRYTSRPMVDLWGLRNLPDPVTTPLPTSENYQSPPQSGWMWDEDEDGEPGVTTDFTGTLNVTLYSVQRTVWHWEGSVLSVDRIQGLARLDQEEGNAVKASDPARTANGTTHQDPSERDSWFDMARLPGGATCADVARAAADGTLASRRPF